MTTRQFQLKEQLDRVLAEYSATWRTATTEKRATGNISRKTTRKLITLEKQIESIDSEFDKVVRSDYTPKYYW